MGTSLPSILRQSPAGNNGQYPHIWRGDSRLS